MPALHIRNVSEETVAALKAKAAAHGRSLEAELRVVLDEAASRPTSRSPRKLNLTFVGSGTTEPFDRHDLYSDDDPDGR
ncbi:MAG: hypothetical protein QM572_19150 [Nocardioides sp.]|uniref:FitA-like ribbon-helix-helix domain-containing protein n=1 Tax=Nocardioides sp. TaxID=35761 RepID=UPI0039E6DF66